jgi:hypothetical protein
VGEAGQQDRGPGERADPAPGDVRHDDVTPGILSLSKT